MSLGKGTRRLASANAAAPGAHVGLCGNGDAAGPLAAVEFAAEMPEWDGDESDEGDDYAAADDDDGQYYCLSAVVNGGGVALECVGAAVKAAHCCTAQSWD